jgi:hypothetical protein
MNNKLIERKIDRQIGGRQMILKISNGPGWRYFDGIEDVEVYDSTYEDTRIDCPTEYMLNTQNDTAKARNEMFVKVIKLFKNGSMYRRLVIDTNNVYLMNNEGKTLERIN